MMKAILKINDKEIEVEVSEEQIKKLTEKKSPFALPVQGEDFYYIDVIGNLRIGYYNGAEIFAKMNKVANYCTDQDLIQQQAWRETLNRLLWRWQYENDKPADWENDTNPKYYIYYNLSNAIFDYSSDYRCKSQSVYFSTREKAKQATEEVVKPFMQEHPDFVW